METTHPLKAYRENHDPPLSQDQLAELLGVSKSWVSRCESGLRQADAEMLARIKERLGIPPRTLRPDLAEIMREDSPQ
jgi:transcriptional regulator with XRE-family HTH domain